MGSSSSTRRKPARNLQRFPSDPRSKSIASFASSSSSENGKPAAGLRRFPSDPSVKSISISRGSTNRKPAADLRGFPSDPSLKSMSSFGDNDSEPDDDMQKTITKQAKEIETLKQFNQKLQNEVTELRKAVEQLTFQLSVASSNNSSAPISPTTELNHTAMTKPKPLGAMAAMKVDTGDGVERNMPQINDHVVAMWGQSKWQYFTATIVSFDKSTLKYTIEWDDHDPTGRNIDYFNLALDQVPSADQIGVGSKVLFHQGRYRQQEVHGIVRSGGYRWHEGEIDKIYKDKSGNTKYQGHHTKGEADGKWVTYKDYSQTFTDYTLEDFRTPPNVFDILASIESETGNQGTTEVDGEIHVFVSYAKINCPSAIQRAEIPGTELPPSYEQSVVDSMCDPRDIVNRLRNMGLTVFTMENDNEDSLLEIVTALKRTKVFIACLSDEYASNDRCRMEFQYAKKTMKLPVIPLVVGTGSFQWQMTVVGLLIAGELYIHFKNKEVEEYKMTELARSIKNFLPKVEIKQVRHPATGDGQMDLFSESGVTVTGSTLVSGKADFFFSYCWSNSMEAEKRRQISKCVGEEFSDPRVIVQKLSTALSMSPWIDVQRLESAADGMGMFGQIAEALKECQIAVACVSQEYANSDNCRMEIQFAAKSLKKPLVTIVVGKGDEWLETTVGKLVAGTYPAINVQNVSNIEELDSKIVEISAAIREQAGFESPEVPAGEAPIQQKFRAPVPGDHVVCLHQLWAYFMATIESFDEDKMSYTVNWDDNDPSGRVQSYRDVALDESPLEGDIGVGTIVLFSQGSYGGTDGNNSGGVRYHQGKITKIYKDVNGVARFDGVHTKGVEEGKWTTYRGYERSFEGRTLNDLRLSPTAMDALMACKQAFSVSG